MKAAYAHYPCVGGFLVLLFSTVHDTNVSLPKVVGKWELAVRVAPALAAPLSPSGRGKRATLKDLNHPLK